VLRIDYLQSRCWQLPSLRDREVEFNIMAPSRLLMAIALCLAPFGASSAGERPVGVVELFTSQGCSSCPAADAMLSGVANDPDIIALSFPVTYWDYLGWKDTLARPEFTDRQRAYAMQRRDRAVYTPQIVVNGRDHVVGSDLVALKRMLDWQRTRALAPNVPLDVALESDVVKVRIPAMGDGVRTATLWLVQYDRQDDVVIARGENRGKTVTYTNVVRQMQPLGLWRGQEMQIDLPASDLFKARGQGIVLLLQMDIAGKPGPVLGAASLTGRPGF